MNEVVKLALARISCMSGEETGNLSRIETNLVNARDQDSEFVVFPEFALTGYCVQDQVRSLVRDDAETPIEKDPSWGAEF